MLSCMSPAGRLESHQRGFWIETLVLRPGDLLSKSSNFFQKKVMGGQPVTRSCRRKPDKMQGCDQASGVPPGIS